jgi:hypothetical protein
MPLEENVEKSKRVSITELSRHRMPHFISAYTNHTEGSPGFYELGLTFCQIAADLERKPVIEQHAALTMTWEHALRVRELLDRLIKGYEKEHGTIRLKPDDPPEPSPPSQN